MEAPCNTIWIQILISYRDGDNASEYEVNTNTLYTVTQVNGYPPTERMHFHIIQCKANC